MTETPDLTFRGLLIRAGIEEGMTEEAATAAADALLPPPPDESTIEGWLRARFLEAHSNFLLYGQHPPPADWEPTEVRGIRPDFVWVDEVIDLPPSAISIATPDEGPIEAILHDPLWNLGRRGVPPV
jgi:hypothetical protein